MARTIAIGEQDFSKIIENDYRARCYDRHHEGKQRVCIFRFE